MIENSLITGSGFQDSRLPRQRPSSNKQGEFAEEGLDIGTIALAGEKCIDKVINGPPRLQMFFLEPALPAIY